MTKRRNSNMKRYIKPATRWAEIEIESLVAQSPGLTDGSNVMNKCATDDDDDNFYSREFTSGSSLWDKEW